MPHPLSADRSRDNALNLSLNENRTSFGLMRTSSPDPRGPPVAQMNGQTALLSLLIAWEHFSYRTVCLCTCVCSFGAF